MSKIISTLALFLSALSLVSCGINGDPAAPSQKESKQKIDLSGNLTDVNPMIAQGAGNVNVTPLQNLNAAGQNYSADYNSNPQKLKNSMEYVKPLSAQPKINTPERLW